ncbi:hypothetical protein [uncultured Hyphomicrobium sp.]|uniref:hypothetical protein n=1 Tax=uncultured Hyphomicrobium sp. TaxID=194373 RepID=UPI0025F045DA|nr:hypothetical protein [uncultured Hyphomicrobium sp.]
MREETRKRLNRLRRHVTSLWLPSFVVLVLLFGGFFAFRTTVRKEREVAGVVQSAVWRVNDDTGQPYPDIQVVLDNDGVVRVGTIAPSLPKVGDRVTLKKRKMLIGYTTYQWDGPGTALPSTTRVSLP